MMRKRTKHAVFSVDIDELLTIMAGGRLKCTIIETIFYPPSNVHENFAALR